MKSPFVLAFFLLCSVVATARADEAPASASEVAVELPEACMGVEGCALDDKGKPFIKTADGSVWVILEDKEKEAPFVSVRKQGGRFFLPWDSCMDGSTPWPCGPAGMTASASHACEKRMHATPVDVRGDGSGLRDASPQPYEAAW